MESNACRLCLSSDNHQLMNIFSDIGIELKMNEIIREHFKSDISEADPPPNVVCQMCWSTTETFHELYFQSKTAQEKFLNASVKTEIDPIEVSKEIHEEKAFIIESNSRAEAIKIESNLEEFVSEDYTQFDVENDDDEIGNDMSHGGCTRENTENETCDKPPISLRELRLWQKKQKDAKFQGMFDENKHLFDLTCDVCPNIFESFAEARTHYATEHNISDGYIKCCKLKLKQRYQIVEHLNRHLNPDTYKCTLCEQTLSTNNELQKHIKRMHIEKTALKEKCPQCDQMFPSVRELKKHIKRKHQVRKEKNLQCYICKKKFATTDGMQTHSKKHEESKETTEELKIIAENFDMTCDQCDAVFTTLYDARSHYKDAHNETKGYIKCCGVKFLEPWIVRDHVKTHINPESFKCDMCGKSYKSHRTLVQHKRAHRLTMNKPLICDFCGKRFRDKEAIKRHIFSKHVKSDPKYECELCHKKFQLPSLLKSHHFSAHREKVRSFTCEVCGKTFYANLHLDKHMLSHIDKSERLSQGKKCEHCGEWLMTKSGVYYHQQIHTTGVQKCTYCEKEVPNRPSLLDHIRRMHRAHKYKCSFCDKTYSNSQSLKEHEEGHTRHNVYPCKFCPKVFEIASSRKTLTRRHHFEELKLSKQNNRIQQAIVNSN